MGIAVFAAALVLGAVLAAPPGDPLQEAAGPVFAPPELLHAGGEELGATSLYPSPVLIDLDGDGVREMVVGGLRGYLAVARWTGTGWGPEARLKTAEGKELKFSNW